MPENRKYFPNKAVLLITTRAEHGIPMPPTHVMNFIIWGCLARAKSMYRIKISHFVFMGNHLHMIVVVDCPQDVAPFMCFLKSELSHAINKLLGRRQRTVWQEGYDSPIVLTFNDVLRYIKYIYLNPTRAGLVADISDYPGVSSWEMFVSGNHRKKCKKVARPQLFSLPTPAIGVQEQKEIVNLLDKQIETEYEFVLEPFAWVDSFPELEGVEIEDIKQLLLKEIAEEHRSLRAEFVKANRRFIGTTDLRRQSMLYEHEPKKFSKKMICICSDRNLRLQFLMHFKSLSEQARLAYQSWKLGDLSPQIPPGMFAPRVPQLASTLFPI